MVDVAEGAGPVDRLHDLVLAMTGRIDDDGIEAVRELLGIGQPDAAAEYLVGCLLAGEIEVSPAEQHQLRRVLDETRSPHRLADRLAVVESLPGEKHRFSAPQLDDTDLELALKSVGSRLSGLRGLWATNRTTPAGTSYGAVPQGVLLAEVGPEGAGSAVAYQLISALRRAGLRYAVDVFDTGAELPEYHREALANARRVRLEVAAGERTAPPVAMPQERIAERRQPDEPPPPPPPMPPVADEPRPEGVQHAVAEPQHEFLGEHATQPPRPAGKHEPAAPAAPAAPAGPATPAEPGEPERPAAELEQSGAEHFGAEPERPAELDEPGEPPAEEAAEQTGVMMKVPAAVDEKLTDRERNLLRKLHEELAHRETDSPGAAGEEGARSSLTGGTGGFPSIAQH
ncbi:hypothetical protein GCM10009854_41810 [Saccharopolyspora halophila]|uniref:Uncharacterized protein n=1 Tax=Saccharopolyspora halophila TaxID=405551 RepID=A0ABN3GR69_9PSEU